MNRRTVVYLDMDGTIADLYGKENWLQMLREEIDGAFIDLEPMTTEERLLQVFPVESYEIRILSMTPKGASYEYCKRVEVEKDKWLDEHFPSLKKRIYKKYGNNKNLKNSAKAILIDDNETIRRTFRGIAIDPRALW